MAVAPVFGQEKADPLKEAYTGEGATPTPTPSPGQSPPPRQEPVAATNTWDFINMILALLVVVGVIYLIFFLLKRGMGKKIVENELIKVLGSRVLSGTKSLHLVEAGGAVYLVGSANDSITLISEIKQKEALDAIRLAASQAKAVRPARFIDALATVFRPGAKKQLEINESVDFMKKQRDRLKKFKP